jgi:FtsP/CotA-like multicopper oxidase with cupredoxin domain
VNPVRRALIKTLVGLAILLAALALGWVAKAWYDSRLPSNYNAMEFSAIDYGAGQAQNHAAHPHVSIETLKGPSGEPDFRVTLVAKKAKVTLSSNRTIDAWTFNGQVPGPELRVRQGDLVEATLVNEDIDDGVTIHWHGVDVPNAEDGVAGVTQDAVMPGERHVYRFRTDQLGTFWYHSHQVSSKQVRRGLYGAFVIEPRKPAPGRTLDLTAIAHDFAGATAIGSHDGVQRRAVPRGTHVRLRLINTNSAGERFSVAGTPYRVVAIDGTDLNGPTPVEDQTLDLGGGGRYDIAFEMPNYSVRLGVDGSPTALYLSNDAGDHQVAGPSSDAEDFDPAGYGRPKKTLLGTTTRFDRTFELEIGKRIGFIDGKPGYHWSLNGKLFPETPMFMVRRGDLVKMRIINNTGVTHPMHLHGHHVLVLSRDGKPVTGSPWWVDTLDVKRDEEYEVAFQADNPGIWMDHCHNLPHAADGMTMHVAYEGMTTPFVIGGDHENHPE